MNSPAIWVGLAAVPLGIGVYAYIAYPAILRALSVFTTRNFKADPEQPVQWPTISICVPVHNEESIVRKKLENLLDLDYPKDRMQIVVVSDASSDETDAIVREYEPAGIELLRIHERGGKTAAENAAIPHLSGEIIVNTDATTLIDRKALTPLIMAFQDRGVGVASGRDVSVGADGSEANHGETGYVGYEMWIRSLETRVGSIVGASGCYYGIRRDLHCVPVPPQMSRDFAAALTAREHGFRAVSVDEAVCYVPRTASLTVEFRRKIRTMARGLDTLFYKKHLLNPLAHGRFAFMLFSHKLCRWLVSFTMPLGLLGLSVLATRSTAAAVALGFVVAGVLLGLVATRWPGEYAPPKLLAVCGYLVTANLAGLLAWLKVARREQNPIWEPTRR